MEGTKIREERRYRLYHIVQGELVRFLRSRNPKKESFHWSMPVGVESLPEGAIVKHVFAEPERGSIGVIVYHKSFDVIEEGVCLPEGEILTFGYQTVRMIPI